MDYKLLQKFFQKYFVVHEQSAVENSLSTYVCYAPDGLFWLNLYPCMSWEIECNGKLSKTMEPVGFKLSIFSIFESVHMKFSMKQPLTAPSIC